MLAKVTAIQVFEKVLVIQKYWKHSDTEILEEL
jgi:hypothetical protein